MDLENIGRIEEILWDSWRNLPFSLFVFRNKRERENESGDSEKVRAETHFPISASRPRLSIESIPDSGFRNAECGGFYFSHVSSVNTPTNQFIVVFTNSSGSHF